MKIRSYLFAAFAVSCFAVSICAQKTVPVKFTSVITNLGTACKTLKGGDGQDDASICKGPGGYQVRIYSSAMTTQIVAELKGKDFNFPIATVGLDFNESRSKVEWRLANGKPFAVIMRVPKYADMPDGDGGLGKKIGEEFAIAGLYEYDSFTGEIDAKAKNAEIMARREADKIYSKKQ